MSGPSDQPSRPANGWRLRDADWLRPVCGARYEQALRPCSRAPSCCASAPARPGPWRGARLSRRSRKPRRRWARPARSTPGCAAFARMELSMRTGVVVMGTVRRAFGAWRATHAPSRRSAADELAETLLNTATAHRRRFPCRSGRRRGNDGARAPSHRVGVPGPRVPCRRRGSPMAAPRNPDPDVVHGTASGQRPRRSGAPWTPAVIDRSFGVRQAVNAGRGTTGTTLPTWFGDWIRAAASLRIHGAAETVGGTGLSPASVFRSCSRGTRVPVKCGRTLQAGG